MNAVNGNVRIGNDLFLPYIHPPWNMDHVIL